MYYGQTMKAKVNLSKKGIIELILLDIRSTYNVGAMFRTADALGVSKIYLVGITPAPVDKFGRVRADIAKAALGSEKTMQWESIATISPLIKRLKKDGFQIIAVEQSEDSIDYKKIKPTKKSVVIMGNEVSGVPQKVLDMCGSVAEIPMNGMKESLNVSVSCGIALFGIFDK